MSRQEKVTKEKATPASGPSLREGCPHSIAAPGARCEGPSLPTAAPTHRSSRGIHAAQPPPRRLRSAS
ncbi:nucleoid-structuring protein H-NS [Stutzerimonas stutzeri]|nr:nucleoid-structuring protein H-NS [Stutzerimonas stutzeri]RRV75671.1 nucleoid-structuring protein H-NS [Stutzerimonas stutzeri]RRV83812.1 nucleoid-structuring protein H-NS [Stutzerimonas stutzeri]RRW17220.1 nucleoid-structuring protein H-NS [Stutzerimonas stutzeri]RSH68538.1 nucleoid-structuring protein H-NS [Stutzerimonas stutzeri]